MTVLTVDTDGEVAQAGHDAWEMADMGNGTSPPELGQHGTPDET
ncbi:hypothetical protein ACWD3J_48270 [Streptomyces sp. NPDC002755]